jgi:hypothetical protein
MSFGIGHTPGCPGAWALDADVGSWAAAVVSNGGTVSSGRAALVSSFVTGLKAAGSWALTDDCWLLVAENPAQALTSLKQRRLATAVNSPIFTADRGWEFDGSTNYINTGFKPATHATAMQVTSARVSVYERNNLSSGGYVLGSHDSALQVLRLRPRSGGDLATTAVVHYSTTFANVTDSGGLTTGTRIGGAAYFSRNGVRSAPATPDFLGTALPSLDLYIGAYNLTGTGAASFRAAAVGFASSGAALSEPQELAEYNALQAYLSAVGAAV